MSKKQALGRLPSAGVVMAMIVALVVVPLASSAFADSPDPVHATMVGATTANPDGTNKLTLSGKWDWSRGCNERVVGWEIDWNDPAQPGNVVGPNGNGIQVDVGAAQANALNPADNLIDQKGLANCQAGGSGSVGDWGPISHTYGANVSSVSVCVIVYDVKPEKIGTGETGKHSTVAGGPGRNTDNSLEENFNDLHEICETKTFQFADPKINIDKTGPATSARGSTITYTMIVTNPDQNVPLTNVTVTDPRCDAGTLAGPAKGAQGAADNNDNILTNGEKWAWTCTHLVTAADETAGRVDNTATATGTGNNKTVTDTDDHTVTVPATPMPLIELIKDGPQEAKVGDSIVYELTVSIPGSQSLHNVTVSDPGCDSTPTLSSKTGGDQDDVLELGEKWFYTCPHTVTAGDPDPLPNTATATGVDDLNQQVSDEDSHLVDLVPQPAIKIRKDGPQEATVGDNITFVMDVSVTEDRPLHNVEVSDPKCDSKPQLDSKSGGDNDDILEVGEVWTFKCDHEVLDNEVGLLRNTATVEGVDDDGEKVKDKDTHVVEVGAVKGIRFNQPPPPPPGILPFTGFQPNTWLFIGVLSALSGAWMLWATKKYRAKAHARK